MELRVDEYGTVRGPGGEVVAGFEADGEVGKLVFQPGWTLTRMSASRDDLVNPEIDTHPIEIGTAIHEAVEEAAQTGQLTWERAAAAATSAVMELSRSRLPEGLDEAQLEGLVVELRSVAETLPWATTRSKMFQAAESLHWQLRWERRQRERER